MLEFYHGKTVLVTGHTGFKGSWLCRILANAGANVVGYSLEAPTNPSLYQLSHIGDSIHSVIGDIRDFNHLSKVFEVYKPEIVFHLAAQPIVRDSYKDPVCTYETLYCAFSILYPSPHTTFRYLGFFGLISIFSRMRRMCTIKMCIRDRTTPGWRLCRTSAMRPAGSLRTGAEWCWRPMTPARPAC